MDGRRRASLFRRQSTKDQEVLALAGHALVVRFAEALRLPVQELSGRQTGQPSTLAGEMGLVGIAGPGRQSGEIPPASSSRRAGCGQEPLEAKDAGQRAGRVPDGLLDPTT